VRLTTLASKHAYIDGPIEGPFKSDGYRY